MARGSRRAVRTRMISWTGAPRWTDRAAATLALAGTSAADTTRAPARTWARRICSVNPAMPVRSHSIRGSRTKVPPARPLLRSTVPFPSRVASAWRRVIRLTPSVAANRSSRGRRSPGTRSPRPMSSVSQRAMAACTGVPSGDGNAGAVDSQPRVGSVPVTAPMVAWPAGFRPRRAVWHRVRDSCLDLDAAMDRHYCRPVGAGRGPPGDREEVWRASRQGTAVPGQPAHPRAHPTGTGSHHRGPS